VRETAQAIDFLPRRLPNYPHDPESDHRDLNEQLPIVYTRLTRYH
jgi:hypothetical protein